jgi:hypothetical protein
MEKITVTQVYSTNQKKDGTPLINAKTNKPYWRVGIKATQYGDMWLNGFLFNDGKDLQGKEIEVEITEEEFNGKTQKRFKLPSKGRVNSEEVEKLKDRLAKLERTVADMGRYTGYTESKPEGPTEAKNEPNTASDEITPDDIPW